MKKIKPVQLLLALSVTLVQAASLGKRGDTRQDGVDLTLRLRPPSPPVEESSSRGESVNSVPVTHDFDPQLHPFPLQHYDHSLNGYLVARGPFAPYQPHHVFEQRVELTPLPHMAGWDAIASSSTHLGNVRTFTMWKPPYTAQTVTHDQGHLPAGVQHTVQSPKFRPILPKPEISEKASSSYRPRGRGRNQYRVFGDHGEIIAESGFAPGDVRNRRDYVQEPDLRMYNRKGEVIDDRAIVRDASRIETLQSALQHAKPPAFDENYYTPDKIKSLFEVYRKQHLGTPIVPAIFQGEFSQSAAKLMQDRIDLLLPIKQ